MSEYIVTFDMTTPGYYQAAAKELDTRDDRKDYGLGYQDLIQLFDSEAVITSVNLNEKVPNPEESMQWIIETVHDHLIFPGEYSIGRMHELGESMAGIMEMLYTGYTVSFVSEVELEHLEALAHKYALPVPERVEEV